MGKLKPISEAPRDGTDILGYNRKDKRFIVVRWVGEVREWVAPCLTNVPIDLFMPLPEPQRPESEDGGSE